ncbi:unnamed protein product [Mytilus coruscus]|uniref:Uncharacterized protein n=1 Tax=Mytilus coruscus TaxID=42192 RepID=A0A6J8AI44_MYTCO|nr:unnamed protein product [Mytilus coruscus]
MESIVYRLKYHKEEILDMVVCHQPCIICSLDDTSKTEVLTMLSCLDRLEDYDIDLASLYHTLVHSTPKQGLMFLYYTRSDILVWLFELIQAMREKKDDVGRKILEMVILTIQEREKVNRTIQLSQIHFDEGDILDSQSTSSRSNSPILNPPPSYSELVTEVHVDQVTDNNNPRNPGRCSLGYDEFCELVNMKEALEQLFKEFEEQEQPMQHPPQHHSPQTAKGLLPLTSQATPPPPYTAQHLRVLNHSNKRSMDSKEGSNGKVERLHRFLHDILAKKIQDDASTWDVYLNQTLAAIRFNKNESSDFSPFFLLYNRDPVLPVDNILRPRRKYAGDDPHKILLEQQHKSFVMVHKNMKKSKRKQKEHADKSRRDIEFKVGQVVFYRNHLRKSQADKDKQLRKTTYVVPPESSDKESENETDSENSSMEGTQFRGIDLEGKNMEAVEQKQKFNLILTEFAFIAYSGCHESLAEKGILPSIIKQIYKTWSQKARLFHENRMMGTIFRDSYKTFFDSSHHDRLLIPSLVKEVVEIVVDRARNKGIITFILCKYRKKLPCSAKRGSGCKMQNVAPKYDRVSQLVSAKTEGDVNTSRDVPSAPMLDNSKEEVANNLYPLLKLAEQTVRI